MPIFRKVSKAPPDDAAALAKWLVKRGNPQPLSGPGPALGQGWALLARRLQDLGSSWRWPDQGICMKRCADRPASECCCWSCRGAAGQDLANCRPWRARCKRRLPPAVDTLERRPSRSPQQGSLTFAVVAELLARQRWPTTPLCPGIRRPSNRPEDLGPGHSDRRARAPKRRRSAFRPGRLGSGAGHSFWRWAAPGW